MHNIYDTDLDRCDANYVSLSPLSFLGRVARVYPDHPAVIHGGTRWTWKETAERCYRLASALAKRNIGPGDTVSVMAPNIPALYESHFGVPMTGAVLNALNIRLDAKTLAFILQHGEAKVLITDTEFSPVIRDALSICKQDLLVIDIDDPEGPGGDRLGELTYEELLTEGKSDYTWSAPDSEWNAIALNYTSGTTGNPKGVVYHHRGAYLNASSNIIGWNLGHHPTYLWTLPMFHCNGWCSINVCAPETWSRFEMQTQLAQIMNKDINLIKKIKLYDIPEMKGRPLNTSMVCNRLNQDTQSVFISLKDAISRVANNYKNF